MRRALPGVFLALFVALAVVVRLVIGAGAEAKAAAGQAALPAAPAGVSPLALGAKAPEFKLFGIDYTYHSLKRYKDAKAVVLIFTCNHCPTAQAYEDPLVALAKQYQPRGIQFLAVNPNPTDVVPADGFPEMIQRAKEKAFPYPYLYDETQEVARAYGATTLPEVFVIDARGLIIYHGAIDSRFDPPRYLADALDDLIAGRPVKVAESKLFGCAIAYRPEKKDGEKAVQAGSETK